MELGYDILNDTKVPGFDITKNPVLYKLDNSGDMFISMVDDIPKYSTTGAVGDWHNFIKNDSVTIFKAINFGIPDSTSNGSVEDMRVYNYYLVRNDFGDKKLYELHMSGEMFPSWSDNGRWFQWYTANKLIVKDVNGTEQLSFKNYCPLINTQGNFGFSNRSSIKGNANQMVDVDLVIYDGNYIDNRLLRLDFGPITGINGSMDFYCKLSWLR